MSVTRAALAGVEVELQVRVTLRDRGHRLDRLIRQRRAAEVRVDDDAGRVDDRPQRWLEDGCCEAQHALDKLVLRRRLTPARDRLSGVLDRLARNDCRDAGLA